MLWDYGPIDPPKPNHGYIDRLDTFGPKAGKYFWPFFNKLGFYPDSLPGTVEWRRPEHANDELSFKDGMKSEHFEDNDVSLWHRDGSQWRYIAVWATNASTEFLVRQFKIAPPPKHLVVVDNAMVMHRTGRDSYDATTRHFVRVGMSWGSNWKPDNKYRLTL